MLLASFSIAELYPVGTLTSSTVYSISVPFDSNAGTEFQVYAQPAASDKEIGSPTGVPLPKS